MEHIIEVTISPAEEVVTALEDNPRAGVARGDTVIWSFTVEKVAGQKQVASVLGEHLDVFPKPSSRSAFEVPPLPVPDHPDQISGRVSLVFEGNQIEYDIRKNDEPLLWADREFSGVNGGCIKPIGG